MGGAHKIARLSMGLITIVGVWGLANLQAGATDEWRSRVSATLLSLYDVPAASQAPTVSGDKGEFDAAALEPHFDAQGRVQADVHYDCSQEAPTNALASAGLSVSSSVKLNPL